jgi:hypothetical protein
VAARWLKASILLVVTLPAFAAAVELTPAQQAQVLAEASAAFDRGANQRGTDASAASAAYRAAAEKFQLLVDAGVRNGQLYYDLGNAYLECGELGRAIASYRRAAVLIPGDGRLDHNLRYARTLRRNQFDEAGGRAFLHTLFFWHYDTALRSRFLVGLGVYVLFWLLLIVWRLSRRAAWRNAALPVLVVVLALGVSVAADALLGTRQRGGVIVANDVVVRKGNGEGYAPQFKQRLYEGVEFVIREQHGDWWHIELPDGKAGWVRADQAEPI